MRLLLQDKYNKIKELQDARLTAKATAGILGTALSTVKKVYQVASYDEYVALATPSKQAASSVQPQQFDQVTTVLVNIADWMGSIDQRLERLEAAHDTKFSFFKGR